MRAEPSPAWDSGNDTIWEEYIDITFVVANSLILLTTSVVGIAANIFVILAVYHQKSLQTSNNALVVNLAVIDILRCVIDCPILLYIITAVHRKGHLGHLICDTQVASFSFSCCIQLLTLACISAERYQAIAQPFKTSQRRKRIMVLIPLTWALAILVAIFCCIFVKDSPVHVRCKGSQRETSSSYDTFGLYMLFPLWAACFGVITGFYARIFLLVRSHNRKIFDKGTFAPSEKLKAEGKQGRGGTAVMENGKSEQNQTINKNVSQVELLTQDEPNSSQKESSAAPLTSTNHAQCVFSSENKEESKKSVEITDLETEKPCTSALQEAVQTERKPFKMEQSDPCLTRAEAKLSNGSPVGSGESSNTKPQTVSSNLDTQSQPKEKVDKVPPDMKETSLRVKFEKPESTAVLMTEPTQAKNSNRQEKDPVTVVDQAANAPETDALEKHVEAEGAVCMMPSKANKERVNKKKESKMAKRAGYIIVTFLFFWLPLITTILVNFGVHKNSSTQMRIIQDVEILSVSVACITSLSDPIIYAAVNPQFRSEFYRLKNKVKSTFSKT